MSQPLLPPPPYVVVLPYYRRRRPSISAACRRYTPPITLFLLLSAAVFLFFPSDPDVSVVGAHLTHLQFHPLPISLDLTLRLTIKLFNRDLYSISYDHLTASVAYRGRSLGVVSSDQGRMKARGTSYLNATVELQGVEFFDDVVPLIADLAKGFITFDTVTEIGGKFGLFFLDFPLKAKVACEIVVDVHNLTISHQNCYPE